MGNFERKANRQGVVAQACNPSTQEVETQDHKARTASATRCLNLIPLQPPKPIGKGKMRKCLSIRLKIHFQDVRIINA